MFFECYSIDVGCYHRAPRSGDTRNEENSRRNIRNCPKNYERLPRRGGRHVLGHAHVPHARQDARPPSRRRRIVNPQVRRPGSTPAIATAYISHHKTLSELSVGIGATRESAPLGAPRPDRAGLAIGSLSQTDQIIRERRLSAPACERIGAARQVARA